MVAVRVSVPEAIPPGVGVNVPGPLIVMPDGAGPTQLVYVFTGDEKPFTEEMKILIDPEPPWFTDTVLAAEEMEKLGWAACEIVRVKVVA